ncbi:MAG TPA: heavy metal-binding domain-containing protein [Blastocatellia bacterium]|nr:heavy metal-binding domain-containing protein [Blastocatellia bacterium]
MISNRRDFLKSGLAAVAWFSGSAAPRNLPPQDQQVYLCPMHPEVIANDPGVCPRCKMKLVRAAAPESADFTLRLETRPLAPRPGDRVRFRFTVFHPATDRQVKEFIPLHEMPFHLFIVSQGFEHFEHLHPAPQPDGSLTIETVLPLAGYYKIFCDFFPAGGRPQVIQRSLVTSGYEGDLVSSQARLIPDRTFVKTIEGTRIELTFDPAQPVGGKPAELHYRLIDEQSGRPVTDLQPYLGAWGHTLILSEDATDYLHSHPAEMIPETADRQHLSGGPEVVFETFFPRPGPYRIWSQFQRQGKIITVPFTVDVPRL